MDYFATSNSSMKDGGQESKSKDDSAAQEVDTSSKRISSSAGTGNAQSPTTSLPDRQHQQQQHDQSAATAARESNTVTSEMHGRPAPSSSSSGHHGENVLFREMLMKRQKSSPSAFFSHTTPQTPRVQEEHEQRGDSSSGGAFFDSNDTAAAAGFFSSAPSSAVVKSPETTMDASASAPVNPAPSAAPAAAVTGMNDKTPRPPIKTFSSSSSSGNNSTDSTKTVKERSGLSLSNLASSVSAAKTTTAQDQSKAQAMTSDAIAAPTAEKSNASSTSTMSTSPTLPPPSSQPSAASSSSHRSFPLPSLRLPFAHHGSNSNSNSSSTSTNNTPMKLPHGACSGPAASTGSASSAGNSGKPSGGLSMSGALAAGRAGLGRAFGAATGGAVCRKGSEVVQNARFKQVIVNEELKAFLAPSQKQEQEQEQQHATPTSQNDVLVLDLRPHTAYVGQGRLLRSVNVCVPSTLLRRPNFALSKIAETICTRRDQKLFNRILLNDDSDNEGKGDKGKGTRVVVLDQETVLLTADSTVHSIMNKIEKSGYQGEIAWIKGGWTGIVNHLQAMPDSSLEELVDVEELQEGEEDEDEEDEEEEEHEDMEMMRDDDGHAAKANAPDNTLASSASTDGPMHLDIQDSSQTPMQPIPVGIGNSSSSGGGGSGSGGAYFQNYLQQGPRALNNNGNYGRGSQSSFTSTASSDSLFPSSIASSQSSTGSGDNLLLQHHQRNNRDKSPSILGTSTTAGNAASVSPAAVPAFDSSKLALPNLRSTTSPAPSSAGEVGAGAGQSTLNGTIKGRAAQLSGGGNVKARASSAGTSTSSFSSNSSGSGSGGGILRPKNLPMAAFQYNSTAQAAAAPGSHDSFIAGGSSANGSGSGSPQKSMSGFNGSIGKGHFQMGLQQSQSQSQTQNNGAIPAVMGKTAAPASSKMSMSLSSGSESKVAGLGRAKGLNAFGKRTAANPFFDNIRQNIESASIDHVLQHVAPLEIPPEFTSPTVVEHLPEFLRSLVSMSPKIRSEKLHKEYFDIEQAEQRRLQKVLDWHCQQSQVVQIISSTSSKQASQEVKDKKKVEVDKEKRSEDSAMQVDGEKEKAKDGQGYHPFSISAGVEKGHLNRYKNMWPYEHARVRLEAVMSPTCGDYINASHIHLRGTSKRYIASQGPLEQTTEHFWRLILQENVHVIVMLTLLQEGGREKCSNYFQSATYGDIQITLKEEEGSEEAMKKSVCKDFGFFSLDEDVSAASASSDNKAGMVTSPAATEKKNGSSPHLSGKGFSIGPLYASTPTQASDSVNMQRYSVHTPSGNSQMHGHKRSMSRRLDSAIVRRTIEIRRKSDPPNTPPKIVRHIQYIKWPDFDIPPDPNVVIDLITETNRAQRDLAGPGEEPPVLVHCSAGVGRTGTFIAVDNLLERYRRERRDARTNGSTNAGPPRARIRRSGSGSDLGKHLNLQDLALHDSQNKSGDKAASATAAVDGKDSASRPAFVRSSTSQESPKHIADRLGVKELLPEDYTDPIPSLVNQMREQRMSSVANAGQYIFTYLALLAGISHELAEEGALSASPKA